MERIAIDLSGREDRAHLEQFLEACLDAARDAGHYTLASISMDVAHIDALAVMEAIDEAGTEHAYIEHPQAGYAIAGAEAVVSGAWSGPERFAAARAFAQEVLDNTIAVGALDNPFAGPVFFCGFDFAETAATGTPTARVFVPHWQVGRRAGRSTAVVNVRIEPDGDIASPIERIWAAYTRLRAFDYGAVQAHADYAVTGACEVGAAGGYEAAVGRALERIAAGAYDKIVLARAVDLTFDRAIRPLRMLNGLRSQFPACRAFSLQRGGGGSFVGATPERLVAVEGGVVLTEAIAGSAPRAAEAREDARLAAALLASEKDCREHQHVVDSIRRRLEPLGYSLAGPSRPHILALANVQHLMTPLHAPLQAGHHILDLAARLHPTPAVGGTPREAALADIPQLEPFERGLFAGLVGFFDAQGEGELCVGIRSALVEGARARLYAGAGIVAGSEPSREAQETRLKMQALREAICAAHGGIWD